MLFGLGAAPAPAPTASSPPPKKSPSRKAKTTRAPTTDEQEVAELRAEIGKLRRQAAQERDVAEGSTHAQLEQLKRAVNSLEYKLQGGGGAAGRGGIDGW